MNNKEKGLLLTNKYDATVRILNARLIAMGYDSNYIEDIIQEAFASAFINLNKLRNVEKFDYWITKIARNIGNKKFKRDKRKIYFVDNIAFENELYAQYGDYDSLSDKVMLGIEVNRLSLKLREAFCLNALSGFEYWEIALILGITPGAAQRRVSRAKAELGKRLGTDQREIDKTIADKTTLPLSVIMLLLSQYINRNM